MSSDFNPKVYRLTELDFLRFLAALAVVLLHYGIRGFAPGDTISPLHFPVFGELVKYNYLGVDLFFMISGFVILMSAKGRDVRGFLISRVVRLYPGYIFSCTLTFLTIVIFADGKIATSLPRYIANLSMLNGLFGIGPIDGPYWTLLVEIKFYLIITLIIVFRLIPKLETLLIFWLALAAINILMPLLWLVDIFILNYAAFFIAGATYFMIYSSGWTARRSLLLISSAIIGFLSELPTLIEKQRHYGLIFDPLILAAIVISFYLIFAWLVSKKTSIKSVAVNRLFGYLGALSYPLYLLHNNIGMIIFNRVGIILNKWFMMIAVIFFILMLSHLVSRYIEDKYSKPFRLWLQRISAPGVSAA